MDGPYHDFGYLSFFSDPLDLARINTVHNFTTFNRPQPILTVSYPVLCGKKDSEVKEKCRICKSIAEDFEKGIKETHKSNFGGGNTHWEERSLGTYATSETRLIEIMERLCSSDKKECHHLVESHEEDLEDYWFKVWAKKKDTDLLTWFCIEKMKVCCPSNTYGPGCTECPGGKDRPCKGNGNCNGEGTRTGTGKCSCNSGYKGDLCDDCKDNYYEAEKNDTHTTCLACHESCKSTCWEGGPKGCDECKSGWTASEEEGCIDINECEESNPCGENQYCTNTPGKYNCATCHRSCTGCSSYGADKCEDCASGYRLEKDTCTDINECEEDKTLCTGDKQHCENKDGSYKCVCEYGFILDSENTCIPKPKDPPKSSKSRVKEKKKERKDKDKPGFWFLVAMIVVFYICCSLVNWNFIVVFFLSIVLGVFIYWFGSQYDF